MMKDVLGRDVTFKTCLVCRGRGHGYNQVERNVYRRITACKRCNGYGKLACVLYQDQREMSY